MRKNVKQQLALRVLSTAALMAMVSSIATAAFAAEYNVKDGSVEIVAKDGVQSITQWADKDEGTYVTDDKGAIKDREDSKIVLTTKNKDTGETETTHNTVTITAEEKGDTANVTLKDVDIEVDTAKAKSGAIEIKGDGNTNLELNGNNTVLTENDWEEEHAAIEKADKYGTGTLTIKDDVNDDGSEKKVPIRTLPARCWQAVTMKPPPSAAVPGKIFVIRPTLPSPAVRLRQSAETMAAAVLAAAADPAVPARTSALRAMHTLLLLVMRALRSAALTLVEIASPLRTMPLSMHTVLMVLPLVMAV